MKKIASLLLIGIILMSACKENQQVKLSGEIKNNGVEPLLILNYQISRVPDTITLTHGKFSTSLAIEQPCFRTLKIGHTKREIFLMPGFDLKIYADAENVDSTFMTEGKGSQENNIHTGVQTKLHKIDYDNILNMDSLSAFRFVDSVYKAIHNEFEASTNKSSLNSKFVEFEQASIGFHEADMKLSIAMEKSIEDTSFFGFLSTLNIENEQYTVIPNYQMFLETLLEFNSNYMDKGTSVDSVGAQPDLNRKLNFISSLKNSRIKEYLIYKILNQQLEFYGVKGFEPYMSYFKKENTDSAFSRQMQKSFSKKSLLAAGKPAPAFTCVDKDSVAHSLSDFKGKYVFIDFWATWCPPCRHELPYYIKLQSDYKGKDIVFLSISVDDSKKNWLDMVNKNKAEGISLFGGKGWSSEAAKAYQVVAIPTFILIDREGNIIDSQAPVPSSKEIRVLLDNLLAKK